MKIEYRAYQRFYIQPHFQDFIHSCFAFRLNPGGGGLDLQLTGKCPQNLFIFDRFKNFCPKNIPGLGIFVHF